MKRYFKDLVSKHPIVDKVLEYRGLKKLFQHMLKLFLFLLIRKQEGFILLLTRLLPQPAGLVQIIPIFRIFL